MGEKESKRAEQSCELAEREEAAAQREKMGESNKRKGAAEDESENYIRRNKSASKEPVDKAYISLRQVKLSSFCRKKAPVEQDLPDSNQEHENLIRASWLKDQFDDRSLLTQAANLSAKVDDDISEGSGTGLISFLNQVETDLIRRSKNGRSARRTHDPSLHTPAISITPVEVIGVFGDGETKYVDGIVPYVSGSSSCMRKGDNISDLSSNTHDQYDFAHVDLEITKFMEGLSSPDKTATSQGTRTLSRIQDNQQESPYTLTSSNLVVSRSISVKHSSTTNKELGAISQDQLSESICNPDFGQPDDVSTPIQIQALKSLVKKTVLDDATRNHLTSLEAQVMWETDKDVDELHQEAFGIDNDDVLLKGLTSVSIGSWDPLSQDFRELGASVKIECEKPANVHTAGLDPTSISFYLEIWMLLMQELTQTLRDSVNGQWECP